MPIVTIRIALRATSAEKQGSHQKTLTPIDLPVNEQAIPRTTATRKATPIGWLQTSARGSRRGNGYAPTLSSI